MTPDTQPTGECKVSYCGIQSGTCAFLPDKQECPLVSQNNTAIRKEEREKVLDDLILLRKRLSKEYTVQTAWEIEGGHIRSLRTEAPKEQQR